MTAGILIRPAKLEDALALADLSKQLGYPASAAALQARIQKLSDPSILLLVAEIPSGQVVGWIQGCVITFLMSDTFVELAGLVVDEYFRGLKIGEKLVTALENWSRDQGVSTIFVRSNAIREDAHRFYYRLNYQKIKTSLTFQKSLE